MWALTIQVIYFVALITLHSLGVPRSHCAQTWYLQFETILNFTFDRNFSHSKTQWPNLSSPFSLIYCRTFDMLGVRLLGTTGSLGGGGLSEAHKLDQSQQVGLRLAKERRLGGGRTAQLAWQDRNNVPVTVHLSVLSMIITLIPDQESKTQICSLIWTWLGFYYYNWTCEYLFRIKYFNFFSCSIYYKREFELIVAKGKATPN